MMTFNAIFTLGLYYHEKYMFLNSQSNKYLRCKCSGKQVRKKEEAKNNSVRPKKHVLKCSQKQKEEHHKCRAKQSQSSGLSSP